MSGSHLAARRWRLSGHVQGVGFRPFVYRLAHEMGVAGWVQNQTGDVAVHGEGPPGRLADFGRALVSRAPAIARPEVTESSEAAPTGAAGFRILGSLARAEADIHVPPDYYTCPDCLRELADPGDRRHGYPFINCTQCGPRYTLIAALPYDRANTSMAGFALCAACRAEYENPLDRRFHAEPVACPACGPALAWACPGEPAAATAADALAACVAALEAGAVVAVKGVGGYHLVCDAAADAAVRHLRDRKPRPHKPLAVMCPATGPDELAWVRRLAAPTTAEADLLRSPMRPIVLVAARADAPLSAAVAPGLAEVGVMLAYSPLHHLLLTALDRPLVATSGNLSGEPVLTDAAAVEARLGGVAQGFLHHDRPILRPADDPVYRSLGERPRPIRLGRGNAPLELALPRSVPRPILAVGGHMKNAVALAWGSRVVISPHIGDMGTPRSLAVFEQVIDDLQRLYGVTARQLVADAHPGYTTRRWADRAGLPVARVHHHTAHASAMAFEHDPDARWLVYTWDGVGYGEDGTLWGGEALVGGPGRWQRAARLRPFRLPGGERAGREPWRSAAALCWETGREWAGVPAGGELLREAWARGVNAPVTSAAGRLFDGAAALAGLVLEASFEGQGPMMLEAACGSARDVPELPLAETEGLVEIDWEPLLEPLMDAARPVGERSALFHEALARALVATARRLHARHPFDLVGLTGGVFQNAVLTRLAVAGLREARFAPRLVERVPPNDGGIAYGQIAEVAARAALSEAPPGGGA